MEKFLILSDLDGTLLNKKSQLTKKTVKYLRKIHNQGHIFAICTGRPYQSAINFFNTININSPLITDNGANIYFPFENTKNISWTIPLDVFKSLFNENRDIIYSALSNSNKYIYIENINGIPFWAIHETKDIKIKEGKLFDIVKEAPTLVMIYIAKENHLIFEDSLKKYPIIKTREWGCYNGYYSYELFNINSSKGNALTYLEKKYNINSCNTISFGDQMNDLEMIKSAHYGVAMTNGCDEIKKSAKYITKYPNYKNGVVKFLKNVLK